VQKRLGRPHDGKPLTEEFSRSRSGLARDRVACHLHHLLFDKEGQRSFSGFWCLVFRWQHLAFPVLHQSAARCGRPPARDRWGKTKTGLPPPRRLGGDDTDGMGYAVSHGHGSSRLRGRPESPRPRARNTTVPQVTPSSRGPGAVNGIHATCGPSPRARDVLSSARLRLATLAGAESCGAGAISRAIGAPRVTGAAKK
jgi:hypothetical protein